jgi:outer membrane protein TolC
MNMFACEFLRRSPVGHLGLSCRAVFFALITVPPLAQNQIPASAGPLRLTLRDAVKLALKQNPQHIVSTILVTESERDRQAARAALLPQGRYLGQPIH